MQRFLPLIMLMLTSTFCLTAQEYRTYDGVNNNLANPEWGATHSPLKRIVRVGYSDGVSEPAGLDRPNPRAVSNYLFSQDGLLNDQLNLSDFCWVFGQFIDHDITLTENGSEPAMIPVPQGDEWFDPFNTGQMVIPMHRSEPMEGTGTSPDNPRGHANFITAYIDGSAVYGSDEERANWLRTFEAGKLKTSAGNLLPFNTIDGELESDIDENAPNMANDTELFDKLFVAGDVRANENPLLTAFHTLFVREHNRICDELIAAHPDWTDEQLYQHARKIVGGLIQNVVYKEWLPAMGVHLDAYTGYKPEVNAGISNVFSAAAFRMGHTLLNSQIQLMDNDGNDMDNMLLRDAFFNPMATIEVGSIDPFFKGMATQIQQDMDAKVIDDVRNFLFGPPGSGGLDLAAININRGRERGLPDYNAIREDLGLGSYIFFPQINPNPQVFTLLHQIYANPNRIDPWVGMLAERHMSNTLFGPTVMEIMKRQFTEIRDGDRFFFENDAALSVEEKYDIRHTTLGEIIRRNTDIVLMQNNVFVAMEHELICAASDIDGIVLTELGEAVHHVDMNLEQLGEFNSSVETGVTGSYVFLEVPKCDNYVITPVKNINPLNGVTTYDIIKILKHILGSERIDSPYRMIAADTNRDNAITTSDLIAIRKLILNIDDNFANNASWRFVDASYVFPNAANPFLEPIPESLEIDGYDVTSNMNFIGIKIGDVNNSAIPNNLVAEADERLDDALVFLVEDMALKAGNTYTIPFKAKNFQQIAGYQFTLNYDASAININDLSSSSLTNFSNNNVHFMPKAGAITASWEVDQPTLGGLDIEKEATVFEATFTAKKTTNLANLLSINSRYTKAEAYKMLADDLKITAVNLEFSEPINAPKLTLFQNTPNPFKTTTTLSFNLPKAGNAVIRIIDVRGKQIKLIQGDYAKGLNNIPLHKEDLNGASGILYFELQFGEELITRKMAHLE